MLYKFSRTDKFRCFFKSPVNLTGRLAQLVRASRSHREGHPFKSDIAHVIGWVLKESVVRYKISYHTLCTVSGAFFFINRNRRLNVQRS